MSTKQIFETSEAPAAVGPYSQAVKIGDLLFISGQVPLDPKSGQVVGANVTDQAKQVMKNLQAILENANLNFTNVIKTSIFIKDMDDFASINEVYASAMPKPYPARACVEVSRLPKDVLVEIEAIASFS